MKKIRLINIDNYKYTFEDNENKRYNLNIQFFDFEPKLEDTFYMPEDILKEKNIFSFGFINKEDKNTSIEDIIKIVRNDEEIYLQRYYG